MLFGPDIPDHYVNHTVRRGDTLYGIGQRFGVTVAEIERYNDVDDPRELQVGQVLMIPYHDRPGFGGRAPVAQGPLIETGAGSASSGSMRSIKLSAARKYIGQLRWPVRSGKLTSRFGYRWMNFHEGIDIAAEEGTPFVAAHAGKVVYSGNGIKGYGNLIILRGHGLLTIYGHNRRNEVRTGDYVSTGDRIGLVGQSGKATGPHVHFETRIRDRRGKNVAVDPLVFYRK